MHDLLAFTRLVRYVQVHVMHTLPALNPNPSDKSTVLLPVGEGDVMSMSPPAPGRCGGTGFIIGAAGVCIIMRRPCTLGVGRRRTDGRPCVAQADVDGAHNDSLLLAMSLV